MTKRLLAVRSSTLILSKWSILISFEVGSVYAIGHFLACYSIPFTSRVNEVSTAILELSLIFTLCSWHCRINLGWAD